jgi:hypothetical protein
MANNTLENNDSINLNDTDDSNSVHNRSVNIEDSRDDSNSPIAVLELDTSDSLQNESSDMSESEILRDRTEEWKELMHGKVSSTTHGSLLQNDISAIIESNDQQNAQNAPASPEKNQGPPAADNNAAVLKKDSVDDNQQKEQHSSNESQPPKSENETVNRREHKASIALHRKIKIKDAVHVQSLDEIDAARQSVSRPPLAQSTPIKKFADDMDDDDQFMLYDDITQLDTDIIRIATAIITTDSTKVEAVISAARVCILIYGYYSIYPPLNSIYFPPDYPSRECSRV